MYAWHGARRARPTLCCLDEAFLLMPGGGGRGVGVLVGWWVDTGPGSNSVEAVEGDSAGGWWLCDECEERSIDWMVLIHM